MEKLRQNPHRRFGLRVALVTGLVLGLVTAFALFGGSGFAAPGSQKTPQQDQYKPGCGKGDPNHTHTGPPGNHNGFPGTCP